MKRTLRAITLLAALAVPGLAHAAASAVATADVNLRAGPSTSYPVVTVVGGGNNVTVYGCLEGGRWCDVTYRGARGWIAANYLAYLQNGRRYTTDVPRRLSAPVVTFSFGTYWDNYYTHRDFYRHRDRYRHGHYDRHRERRYDHRDRYDRHERDRDRREARREWREERREARREWREERREARRDWRDGRHDGWRDGGDRQEWWRRH